jgi:streptomycin 6-kinase
VAAPRAPRLAIDPKAFVGDPAYDVLQHAVNCKARLVADPGRLARRLSGRLDLDTERVELRLFARTAGECVELLCSRPVAAALAPS